METIRINKLGAASRQIDAAIRVLFASDDLVAVHTLAGAASAILSRLIEIRAPERSWDKLTQEATGIDRQAYFEIMRRTQNFLKHATDDPDGVHEFRVTDTTGILMWAVMNLAELQTLTTTQQVFQLWFLACNLDLLEPGAPIAAVAKGTFRDLTRRSMIYRVAVGRRVLSAALAAG